MSLPIDPRHKVLWHADKLQELRLTGRTNAPVNVEIDLSNRCSLGCTWCHFAYTHTRGLLAGKHAKPEGAIAGGDLMDAGLAAQILQELAIAGVQSVTWTGGGEPTLHPDFETIVEFAASLGIKQGMYTHGGHIDDRRAALLKQSFSWVYVSLDAANATDYKHSKGVDRFAAVCANVGRLVAAQGDATIGIGYLVHRDNIDAIPDAIELAHSLGADYIQFRPTIAYDQLHPDISAENTEWVEEARQVLRLFTGDPFVIADLERFKDYQKWAGHGYATCYWAALQTVITPNGKVWRCLNKREHGDAMLGDLTQESFADIWARAGTCAVDGSCRVMCRGHVPNQTLNAVMAAPVHPEFI